MLFSCRSQCHGLCLFCLGFYSVFKLPCVSLPCSLSFPPAPPTLTSPPGVSHCLSLICLHILCSVLSVCRIIVLSTPASVASSCVSHVFAEKVSCFARFVLMKNPFFPLSSGFCLFPRSISTCTSHSAYSNSPKLED